MRAGSFGQDFKSTTHGKWILAGEHAVLRGCPALVFPLRSRELHLSYIANSAALEVELIGAHGRELELLLWGVIEKACSLVQRSRADLRGKIGLESNLPVGAGMGASAALSVSIAKWFCALSWLQEKEVYEFSRQLENLFHGESSGVDIAVAISNQALMFEREGRRESFNPAWTPRMYISYSGQRGVTSDCVSQVKKMIATEPERAQVIDAQMRSAVLSAHQALMSTGADRFEQLVSAVRSAGECFESWGLSEPCHQHMNWLKSQGATVVKPTGSGGGGYVLSLWQKEPSADTLKNLISCF